MRFTAERYDEQFQRLLLSERSPTLTVHSVYRRLVNFIHGHQLYTLSGATVPASFFHCRLQETIDFTQLELRPGDIAVLRTDSLTMGSIVVDLQPATLYNPPSPRLARGAKPDQATLLTFLRQSGKRTGSLHYYRSLHQLSLAPFDVMDERLRFAITNFVQAFRLAEGMEESVQALMGLGRGLTPAGDDFLAGFLYTRQALAPHEERLKRTIHKVEAHYPQTGDVTRQMYQVFLQHAGTELHRHFLETWFGNDPVALWKTLLELENLGHTSGLDFVVGCEAAVSIDEKE